MLLRDNILLAIPMLQLLKIVFTFGKELLIALCQSDTLLACLDLSVLPIVGFGVYLPR